MRAVAVRMHDGRDAPSHTPLSRSKEAEAKHKKKQSEIPLLQVGGSGRPRELKECSDGFSGGLKLLISFC